MNGHPARGRTDGGLSEEAKQQSTMQALLTRRGSFEAMMVGVAGVRFAAAARDSPAQSPLEAVVSIRGGGRFPRPVLRDLQEAVERASGYQVLVAWQPFSNGMQPRIVENFEGVKAPGQFGDRGL